MTLICKTSGITVLLAASDSERGRVMGVQWENGAEAPHLLPESCKAPLKIPLGPAATQCLPNSKFGFFMPEKSKLEK